MNVTIEKIVYPGRRLARHEGRVYFTDEGLPGETVDIVPVAEHKSYIEARTIKMLSPSPDRRPPRCSHYLACSPFQTMDYPRQVEAKARQLEEILSPIWEIPEGGVPFTPSPLEWRYRNRIRLALVPRGGTLSPAYHLAGRREDFVEVDDCHLASESAVRLIADIALIAGRRKASAPKNVEVRESLATGEQMVSLFWKERPEVIDLDPIVSDLASSSHPLAGIVSFYPEKGRSVESVEWGRGEIEDRVGETVFRIGAASFFQVNGSILPAVLADMRSGAGSEGRPKVADVYGGIGTFGLALAPAASAVLIVESEPANVRALAENIARNKAANVTICEGRSEDWMPWLAEKRPDVVIVDPPRKGLAPDVIRGLIMGTAAKILYLSCNPATLARDLAALKSVYEIVSVRGYDFFPHTPHIEALAMLRRRR